MAGSTADGSITLHGWTEPHSGTHRALAPTLCHRSQLTQRLDDLGLTSPPAPTSTTSTCAGTSTSTTQTPPPSKPNSTPPAPNPSSLHPPANRKTPCQNHPPARRPPHGRRPRSASITFGLVAPAACADTATAPPSAHTDQPPVAAAIMVGGTTYPHGQRIPQWNNSGPVWSTNLGLTNSTP